MVSIGDTAISLTLTPEPRRATISWYQTRRASTADSEAREIGRRTNKPKNQTGSLILGRFAFTELQARQEIPIDDLNDRRAIEVIG